MVGQAGNLVRGVANVNDRKLQLAVQGFQIGQDFQLALEIDAASGFIASAAPWGR